jgi:ubiquinone/menaquinone biosynthesis C-methylase UbiE
MPGDKEPIQKFERVRIFDVCGRAAHVKNPVPPYFSDRVKVVIPMELGISAVTRTKAEARKSYDRLSKFYDIISGGAEQKVRDKGLARLNIAEGESVLEIGFGTGQSLIKIAKFVGENGRVYGIDISPGMKAVSQRKLDKAGVAGRVDLLCDDALHIPYSDASMDIVFTSFTVELFDTPEIPILLSEIRRVLKPSGKLGLVSMSTGDRNTLMLWLYEWFHRKMPRLVDCRPIRAENFLQDAGFEALSHERVSLWGLPVDIILAGKKGDSKP